MHARRNNNKMEFIICRRCLVAVARAAGPHLSSCCVMVSRVGLARAQPCAIFISYSCSTGRPFGACTHARTHARAHAHTHERTHGTVKRYPFSDRHDAWLDTNDDHECIQLFTHELIRKCTGYPSF